MNLIATSMPAARQAPCHKSEVPERINDVRSWGVIRTEYARCEPFRFWTPLRTKAGWKFRSAVIATLIQSSSASRTQRYTSGCLLLETIRESFGLFEPIRKVLESDESDVIPCWALDSVESARCGSLDSALSRTAVAFVTRAI